MASIVSFSAGSSPSTLRQPEAPLVLLLQQDVVGEQPPPVDGAVEEEQEVVGVHGLGQEVGGALLHGRTASSTVPKAVMTITGMSGVRLQRGLQDVEPAARGQAQVGEDHEEARRPGAAGAPRRRRPPRPRCSRAPRAVLRSIARRDSLSSTTRMSAMSVICRGRGSADPARQGAGAAASSSRSSTALRARARPLPRRSARD